MTRLLSRDLDAEIRKIAEKLNEKVDAEKRAGKGIGLYDAGKIAMLIEIVKAINEMEGE